jgi:MoaA/NifB/PqqE/SkfB family radical SAM enzyme
VDCTAHVELGSSEHLARVVNKAYAERVPLSGSFDLKYRCNFRCVHCYAGHLVDTPRSEAAEMSTRQVISLLREAADAGCLLALLSGGEPLVR